MVVTRERQYIKATNARQLISTQRLFANNTSRGTEIIQQMHGRLSERPKPIYAGHPQRMDAVMADKVMKTR